MIPSSPFPPRPDPTSRQDDPYVAGRTHPRPPSTSPSRSYLPQNEPVHTPRSILRPTPLLNMSTPHNPSASSQISRPQPPPVPRGTISSPYHHHHTSSSPELRPRVDTAWPPRVRPYPQQHLPDLSQPANTSAPTHTSSHFIPRPRPDQDDSQHKQSGLIARLNPQFVPGNRGRSASEVRIAHTPPPDLEPDRLARACGQPAPTGAYRLNDHARQGIHIDSRSSRLRDSEADPPPSHPPVPKVRVGHMYRRLDALARRHGHRAIDYVSIEDIAAIHKHDAQLREQSHRKRSDRLQERDPTFHAIGAPLEDVFLYASTAIDIGDYQHHLPIVVVACIEELTKTGIYQSGLFRALPSRDRHLQLIDLFDKSPDFGAEFNMRGQAMPDICALLSTFISSLPSPLLDVQIYSALWHWSVKPSVKREDARRDRQEEEEEDRRARGELPRSNSWMRHTDLHLDDAAIALETDQISTAQILLRFLPSANLSLLVYLCGFFTQLPLCPENGLQLEDVARIFGHRLLGGTVKVVSQRMMMWLLTRWHRVSETLFGETCGMTPPPSPSRRGGSEVTTEGNHERIEKRKGERDSSEDTFRHASPSSSSSPSSDSPDGPGASRKSTSGGEEEDTSEGCRRRKKREVDVPESRTHSQVGRRSSTRKEPRHGHGHGRRGSGSRRHHRHAHSSEPKNAPASPDPFAMAFAKAQLDLADAPLLTAPPGAIIGGEGRDELGDPTSRFDPESAHLRRFDTPVRIAWSESDSKVDASVVDALLQQTVVATGAQRALAGRVEALERVLQVRVDGDQDSQTEYESGAGFGSGVDGEIEDVKRHSNMDVEDGLRLQLRIAEAERCTADSAWDDSFGRVAL